MYVAKKNKILHIKNNIKLIGKIFSTYVKN